MVYQVEILCNAWCDVSTHTVLLTVKLGCTSKYQHSLDEGGQIRKPLS